MSLSPDASPARTRRHRSWLLVLACFVLALTARAADNAPRARPPDVLFLAIDDLNDWITLLDPSAPIATPNLERLARRGVSFTRAYAASPACNPSRAALLTGRAPSSSGIYGNTADWRAALPDAVTLPQAFMRAGYRVEEPLVKFFPVNGTFVADAEDFANIVDLGGGTFRMLNRFNAEWWDGDRDTLNKDRQRAEVKGLGPHQRHGETFEYATTWRLNAGFRGTAGFCHLFQLKAINGDSGAPLVTLSIRGDVARVEATSATARFVAREFPWKPGVWQTVRIRVTTSPGEDGALLVSVDGDAFAGREGVALARPAADAYRPKWGLYRRASVGAPMSDDHVEHKDVSARKLGAPVIDNAPLETAARARARMTSPAAALAWLQTQPASPAREFALASIATLWAETAPAAAMAWTESLPTGPTRADATSRILSRWGDRDVGAAIQWVRTLAPAPDFDLPLWMFAADTTYRYVNRPVALEAAALIHDSTLRAAAFEHVLEIWSRTQRDEALAYLDASSALTADRKSEIAAQIHRRRAQ